MRNRYTRIQKRDIVREFQNSGMSLKEFSDERSVNYYTLRNWCCEYDHYNSNSQAGFVELKTTSMFKQESITSSRMIIIKKLGIEVRVPCDLEFIQMKKVLEVLAAL